MMLHPRIKILFVSDIDFPDTLDRGARYHVHYWLKALSGEHDVDFLLVESYSQHRVNVPQLAAARVINLGEPHEMGLHHGLDARGAINTLGDSQVSAVEYVQQAVKYRRYDLAILWADT